MTLAELTPVLTSLGIEACHVPVLVRPRLVKERGDVLYLPDAHDALNFPDGAFVTHDEMTAMGVTLAVRHHMGTLV